MHQHALPHIDAWPHAMSRCPWYGTCVRLHLITRLLVPYPCHAPPIPLVYLLYQCLLSSHLSHSTEPWYCTHGLVILVHRALRPYAMHRHVEFDSVACLVALLRHVIAPMAFWTNSMHKSLGLFMLTWGRGEGIGRTRPYAITATRCTPHMLWSPCVHASVSPMRPRHTQGRAMVPHWCDQGLALVPPLVTYHSL